MLQLLQQLLNGLSIGSVYALIALGYTMVYGIIKLINFAHGDIFMLGSYIGMFLITLFNFPLWGAFIVSMLLTAIFGILLERLAYKPLRNSSRTTALITAIGISILLQNAVQRLTKAKTFNFPNPLGSVNITFFGLSLTSLQIFVFILSIILMFALHFLVQKTRMGRAMRAVAVDKDAAILMGVDVDKTISFTFALGSALAAAAGILFGLLYNKLQFDMGFAPGLKAFVAAVLGGIGIIPGAMIGGFAIGLIETFIAAYGSSAYKDAVVYGILILILLFKPSGLLGKHVKEKV